MPADASLNLKNIGPDTEAQLRSIGITTKAQFDKLGADKAYKLLLEAGHKPSSTLRYKLKGAEHDLDWHIMAERDKRSRTSRTADQDEP